MIPSPVIAAFVAELLKEAALKADVRLQAHQQDILEKSRKTTGILANHGLGSGKCVRAGTLVLTSKGMLPIESLFGEQKEGAEPELFLPGGGLKVLTHLSDGSQKWTKVRQLYRQRLLEEEHTYGLTTRRGAVEITAAHHIPVVRDGKIQWVRLGDVCAGDYLVQASHLPSVAPQRYDISDDLLSLWAWQITEGWENAANGVTFITQDDVAVLEFLQDCFTKSFPVSSSGHIRLGKGKRSSYLEISCVEYRKELEHRGYEWGHLAAGKAFPWLMVCSLSSEQISMLLSVLFDAEGSVGVGNLEWTSASKTFAEQVQFLLLRLGIIASLHKKWGRATNSAHEGAWYWRLSVSGEEAEKFYQQISLYYAYKEAAAAKLAAKTRNPNIGIPIGGITARLATIGISPRALGLSSATLGYETVSRATAEAMLSALWEALEDGEERLTKTIKRTGGTARKWAQRTLDSLLASRELIEECVGDLYLLLNSDFSFERVEDISKTGAGGFVYDLEVDSDVYEEKNYVVGSSGFIIHNTLSAYAIAEDRGGPVLMAVPASLRENARKQLAQFVTPERLKDYTIVSYDQLRMDPGLVDRIKPNTLIGDEFHRLRNSGANRTAFETAREKTPFAVGLTGSLLNNRPEEIVPLVNLVAGKKNRPFASEEQFKQRYLAERKVDPGLLARIRGIKPGISESSANLPEMAQRLAPFVHRFSGDPEYLKNVPTVQEEEVPVEMSSQQEALYNGIARKNPALAYKIRHNLPPSKTELKNMNSFMTGLRQVSNNPAAFDTTLKAKDSPKLQRMLKDIHEASEKDPNFRSVIYSNFLESGVEPVVSSLGEKNIPSAAFTGELTDKLRRQTVENYNTGKLKVLGLSPAGGEGLDLKGTKMVQLAEEHWNPERGRQAIGRAARYKSHDHLPEAERNVTVRRYLSVHPKKGFLKRLFTGPQETSADEWINKRRQEKLKLNQQFVEAIPSFTPPPAPKPTPPVISSPSVMTSVSTPG